MKKTPVNENDFFVSIFSPSLGKIDAIAKGARKIESHFTGHLELLNTCVFQLYNKNDRYLITQCQSTGTHKSLKNSLEKTGASLLVLEIFLKSSLSEEHGQELFNLLQDCFTCMETGHSTFFCVEIFKIKLLKRLGVLPDTTHCGICNKRWAEKDTIYLETQGKIICEKCLGKRHTATVIPFNIIKFINYICVKDFKEILKVRITDKENAAAKNISDTFLEIYLQTEIKSERVIASMKPL